MSQTIEVTYGYRCRSCGHGFKVERHLPPTQGEAPLAGYSEPQPACPACLSDDTASDTRVMDEVEIASMDSFPCSDPPGYI